MGRELAEGELLQLSNVSNEQFSEDVYFEVIRKKTAALFAACTKAGSLVGRGRCGENRVPAPVLASTSDFVSRFATTSSITTRGKEVGKPTGNDMLEGKLTLPALYALNSTHDKEAAEIALRVKSGKATSDEIGRLIAFAKQQGGIEYAVRTMNNQRDKALELLSFVPAMR